jgi:hypothetical protein
VFRLPAEKAFTVNTVSGSGTITVTGGPSLLKPGDYIWSDAFPFGTPIINVSGTLGAQIVVTGPYHMDYNAPTPATKSETGGHMWILPAGLKMFVQTSLHTNYFSGFAWGLEMECSAWGTPIAGCNGSLAQENIFFGNMIGRLVLGDNSGASLSIMNVYAYDTVADIAELGAVGSNYLAENANSQEDHTALYGIIGYCTNSNSSSFYGGYAPTEGGYCTNGIGVATSPGGNVEFYNPIAGAPSGAPQVFNGGFHNRWFFDADDAAQTQLCMNEPNAPLSWSRGNQSCGGPGTWQLGYDTRGFWGLGFYGISGGSPLRLTEGALGSYTGYLAGNLALPAFQTGFLLQDAEAGGSAPGPERLVDGGTAVPAASFHKQGDIHFNQAAAVGAPAGWINTAAGANFQPFGTVSSFSGTKTAGSCTFTIVNGVITNVTGC